MTDALRPSELFRLRWRDFNHDECLLELRETVYRGKLRNWGKTRKALRPVHIPKEPSRRSLVVAAGIEEPRARRLHLPKPVGRIHRSAELSEEDAEVGRGLATAEADLSGDPARDCNAQKKGTPKDIQSVLRHSRLATTTDVYMQEIPESVKATVEAINKELRLTPYLAEAS
jgi:integrase